jgi:hypothetical protein
MGWQRTVFALVVVLGTARHGEANEDHAASVLKNLKREHVDGTHKVSSHFECWAVASLAVTARHASQGNPASSAVAHMCGLSSLHATQAKAILLLRAEL